MAGDGITINTAELRRAFKAFPASMINELRKEWGAEGQDFIKTIQKERFGPETKSDQLATRTGTLRRSFRKKITGRSFDNFVLLLFTNVPYARIQEEGGTIKPEKAQFLAIPTQFAKTAAGVPKYSGPLRDNPELQARGVYPIATPWGLVLMAGDTDEPLFSLVRQVKIPPRLGMKDTLDKKADDFIRAANRAAQNVWRRGK